MPTKAEQYAQMADSVATRLTGSWQEWAAFLTTAARLYKYPYHEQLMIYAQRPEATACAEYDLWNDKMGRYIRRGSKGIALVDDSGDTPRLRYVFDIADTGTRPHSRHPYLWSMEQKHTAPVQAMLERRYDIGGDSLPQQLADVAGKLADEFWTDNGADILHIVDDSFLEEYDNLNVAVQFKSAATISITYALMSRCGLEPERYFDHEDFMAIFDFNTPATVAALGTAVSKSCQEVLRQIGITIQNVEREAIAERRNRDEQQLNLQNERGLSDTRPRTEPDRQPAVGQVRENEKIVPETASPGDLQPDASLGNSVSAPRGDRADGEQPHRADDAGTDAGGRRDREPESHRPDDVGRTDEQLQGTGGGNRLEGAYSQLSFFPTETEQIYRIDEAESVQQTPFAFSFAKPQEETPQPVREVTQVDIDAALQVWNGDIKSKQRTERYMLDHARDKDTAAWLKAEFGGELPVFSVPLSGTDQTAALPWAKVQRHLAKLVKEDRFFTEEEQNNFDNIDTDYVREQLESGEESPFVHQVMADAERIQAENTLPEQRNPLAPAYQVGDQVYLENKPFIITEVGAFNVQLRDPTLSYPIFRAESRDNFEHLLRFDQRNGTITEFLPANLDAGNADLQDALTGVGGLLGQREKELLSGWLRSGEGNTHIMQRLSESFAGAAETITLQSGEEADYFASTTGFEINIHDKFNTHHAFGWQDIAPILRAMYQQERDGFSHEPVEKEPVTLEGTPTYQEGDAVTLPYPDRDIRGTIGHIGEQEVRIDTGPYSWSNEVVSRDTFDEGIRHDERNAGLFTPEAELPASENFRIADDHLGEGGAKAKFRANMDAIATLKKIESDNIKLAADMFKPRTATVEEQAVLSRYVGWGGLPDAFDTGKPAWAEEYKELLAALSPSEYEAARASTLNAHYTSPAVIRAIYEAVGNMGFTTGNILEPSCGIGNFFGMLPESMSNSRLYGVELDSITGRIAQQLYPKANITVAGFETTDRRDFFDLAVGNVPFGQYKVNDSAYNRLGFNIHNYFFGATRS